MPHFKNANNELFWLDANDDPAKWLPSDCVQITDTEATAIRDENTPAPVIAPISPRQIRQALTRAGLRTAVEAAVAAGDQDLKDWYEFSTAFERLNPQVVAMGEALSVSPASLDDLWALGASL